MRFSVIFPTRERPALLAGLLESLDAHTTEKDSLEVIVAWDSDDYLTREVIPSLGYPFVRFLECERAKNFSVEYYNRMAKMSSGKYVIACNDDCAFETPGWDSLAWSALTAFPHAECYGKMDDGYNHPVGFTSFPLLSREAILVQGYFFHPAFVTWSADDALYRVWNEVGRVCYLPFLLRHISYHCGTRPRDSVNERVGSMARVLGWDLARETARIRYLLSI